MPRASLPHCMCALKGDAKNSESLTGMMPRTTLCCSCFLSSSHLTHKPSPVWRAQEQMEPETSVDSLRLRCLKASWIRHNRSQDNATVLQSVFWRLETLCAEGQKGKAACVEEGSGASSGDRDSARQAQTGHFPYMQEAEGTDSAVLDSIAASMDARALFLHEAIPSHQPLGGRVQLSQHNTDENVTMWPVLYFDTLFLTVEQKTWLLSHGNQLHPFFPYFPSLKKSAL